MSDIFDKGDRIRVTIEGEVRDLDILGRHVSIVGVMGNVPTPYGSVALVERKSREFKPGTILDFDHDRLFRHRGGRWHWVSTAKPSELIPSDREAAAAVEDKRAKVLYEPQD